MLFGFWVFFLQKIAWPEEKYSLFEKKVWLLVAAEIREWEVEQSFLIYDGGVFLFIFLGETLQ